MITDLARQLLCGATAAFALTIGVAATFAHEGHQMECTLESVNAMKADIQAMADGEAKKTAMKEMQVAQEMVRKKDTKGCMEHMNNAMQTMEK